MPRASSTNTSSTSPSARPGSSQSSNIWRTPYLYTSKELDPETGLYYFGARYYDPRTSVWQSADPILGKYLSGEPSGGVFNPFNLGLYSYARNNPVVYLDPNGQHILPVHQMLTEFSFSIGSYKMSQRALAIVVEGNRSVDTCAACQTNAPSQTNKHAMRGVTGYTEGYYMNELGMSVSFNVPVLQSREEAVAGAQAIIDDRINAAVAEAIKITGSSGQERVNAIEGTLYAIGEATHTAQDILQHAYAPYTANGLGQWVAQNPLGVAIHGARDALVTPGERLENMFATQQVYDTFRQRLSEQVGPEQARAIDNEISNH